MYVSWSSLEPALSGTTGWRRRGRVWAGPCPVTGAGTDTCWMHPGSGDTVRGGCRRCHPLARDGFHAHLVALLGSGPSLPVVPRTPRPPAASDLPYSFSDVWDAALPLAGTPADRYLLEVRRCVGFGSWPHALRFLPLGRALELGVRPVLPLGAAGALLYGFRSVGEPDYLGLQLEAVAPDGARLSFRRLRATRVSVLGSVFRGGRRFDVRVAGADRLLLAEGPVSALAAVLRFPAIGSRWAVAGVAGWSGFTLDAVGSAARVVLCADGDPDGRRAVARLAEPLRAAGRTVFVVDSPDGTDVADLWRNAGATDWRPQPDD